MRVDELVADWAWLDRYEFGSLTAGEFSMLIRQITHDTATIAFENAAGQQYSCSTVDGLTLRVYPENHYRKGTPRSATYYFCYQTADNRPQEIDLGSWHDVSLYQVRQRAQTLGWWVADGRDPVAEARRRLGMPVLEEFVYDKVLRHLMRQMKNRDSFNTNARLIVEELGHKALDEVTRADVTDFRKSLKCRGFQMYIIRRYVLGLRRVMQFAIDWRYIRGPNPVDSSSLPGDPACEDKLSA